VQLYGDCPKMSVGRFFGENVRGGEMCQEEMSVGFFGNEMGALNLQVMEFGNKRNKVYVWF